ncbi:MAG: hypothetical protein FWF18_06205, partial [Dehalococcoidia bacterium]|nr:hypothetical protein [Dehalococcoidia bacterium]
MIKRIISLLLVVVLILAALPFSAVAVTDDVSNVRFLAAVDPPAVGSIPISNRAELAAINNNLSGKYHLTNDIDLSDGSWVPVGSIGVGGGFGLHEFKGLFDGQGYVIHNLTIRGDGNVFAGLFGAATRDAIIRNVGLEAVDIDVSNNGGSGFPTNIGGGSYNNTYGSTAGGIAGYGGNISNCYVTGSISTSAASNLSGPLGHRTAISGGISGYGGLISNCFFVGSLSSSTQGNGAYSYAGGISGFIETNSYYGDGSVSNCYSVANISLSTTASYSMFDTASAGGICGFSGGNATVRNSYWSIDSVQSVNGAALATSDKKGLGSGVGQATALTSEQMRQQSSFSGWDFINVWTYRSGVNNGYPVLGVFFPESYTIVATAGAGGTVTGSGTFNQGATVTLQATPNTGFKFDGWYQGNTSVSTNATLTFNATADRTLEARFSLLPGAPTFDNPHSGWAREELERAFIEDLVPPLLRAPDVDLRAPITREEFAGVVVLTYQNLSGIIVPAPPVDSNPFTDTRDIYVRMAHSIGIMVGTSATQFDPNT